MMGRKRPFQPAKMEKMGKFNDVNASAVGGG
jgi:hypothetical protein